MQQPTLWEQPSPQEMMDRIFEWGKQHNFPMIEFEMGCGHDYRSGISAGESRWKEVYLRGDNLFWLQKAIEGIVPCNN